MDADLIKNAVARYFTKKRWAVHFEVGLQRGGRRRADVLCVNLNAELVLVECKSSVADFRTDHKWQDYLLFSDKFYFAFDAPTHDKVRKQIPAGVGIFVVAGNSVMNVQPARYREDLLPDVRLDLILRMAYRSADRNRYRIKSKFNGIEA